ncbi:MAG: hypothetical protein ACRD2L_19105, partial [Terriglobia bacterium]
GFLPVFAISQTDLERRADRPVDMSIRPIGGGLNRLAAEQTLSARWQNMELGRWELCVNGHRYIEFEVAEARPPPRALIVAQFDNQSPVALMEAQQQLQQLLSSHAPPKQILLRWDHPAITSLLKINGLPVSENQSTMTFTLAGEPDLDIDAENLGHFVWRDPNEVPTVPIQKFVSKSAAPARAKWLLSVASRRNVPDSIKIVVPEILREDPAIGRLHGLWLPVKYAPQINALLAIARTR